MGSEGPGVVKVGRRIGVEGGRVLVLKVSERHGFAKEKQL